MTLLNELWADRLNTLAEGVTDSKGKEIKAGDTLVWKDDNGDHTGKVSADPKYNGGLRVGGRSVKNIIDDSDSVKIMTEAKNYMDETEYNSWSSWRAACRKMFGNEVTFEGDKDIAQAMVGKMGVGEWDGEKGVVYSHVHKKDGAVVVKEGRKIPSWFKDGARVKLTPQYADKDPNEVFTLKSVDDERGTARLADEDDRGWNVSYYQVYPKNGKPPVDEDLNEDVGLIMSAIGGTVVGTAAGIALAKWAVDNHKKIGKMFTAVRKMAYTTPSEKEAEEMFARLKSGELAEVMKALAALPKYFKAKERRRLEGVLYDARRAMKKLEANSSDTESAKELSDALKTAKELSTYLMKDSTKAKLQPKNVKESAELQAAGKALAGKAKPTEEPVAEPATDEAPPEDEVSDEPVVPDEMADDKPAEFKVGDTVTPLKGPHKGQPHEVIHVFDDGAMNIRPKDLEADAIKYRLGAAKAQPDEVTLAEGVKFLGLFKKGSLVANIDDTLNEVKGQECPRCHSSDIKTLSDGEKQCHDCKKTWDIAKPNSVKEGAERSPKVQAAHDLGFRNASKGSPKSNDDTCPYPKGSAEYKAYWKAVEDHAQANPKSVKEGRSDGMMPLSYRPKKGNTVEGYGRKGMKNTQWRKYFKDYDALNKWCEDNDATCEGSRELEANERVKEDVQGTVSILFATALDEGFVKKLKRMSKGWGVFPMGMKKDTPREFVNKQKAYDTDTLKMLAKGDRSETTKGSQQDFQHKVIDRELKKRGEK